MTNTGKKARQQYGTRAAAKAAKRAKNRRRASRKCFGQLPVSEKRGNAIAWRSGGIA